MSQKKKIGKHHPILTFSAFRSGTKKPAVSGDKPLYSCEGRRHMGHRWAFLLLLPTFLWLVRSRFPAKEYISCLTGQPAFLKKWDLWEEKRVQPIHHVLTHYGLSGRLRTNADDRGSLSRSPPLWADLRLDDTPSLGSLDCERHQGAGCVSSLWHPHFLSTTSGTELIIKCFLNSLISVLS